MLETHGFNNENIDLNYKNDRNEVRFGEFEVKAPICELHENINA